MITRRTMLASTTAAAALVALPFGGARETLAANASVKQSHTGNCFVDHEALAESIYHNIPKAHRINTVGAEDLHKSACPICAKAIGQDVVALAATDVVGG